VRSDPRVHRQVPRADRLSRVDAGELRRGLLRRGPRHADPVPHPV